MAELAKKLHFKKGTTEHLAKAYSTTAEAGAEYITNKIDGVTAYVPIGATNDSRATMGRVKKSGGTEKAILTMGKPPYTEKAFTTAGTFTFTIPANVKRIRVAVCGGGGGCATTAEDDNDSHTYTASTGGTSSFGSLISATGGKGGYAWVDTSNERREYGGNGGAGGSPNGRTGNIIHGNGTSAAGQGFALNFNKANGSYGTGGNAYTTIKYDTMSNAAGGSGGYNTGYFNVTPGTTYPVTVGNFGASVAGYWEGEARTHYDGKAGFVLIAYGGDI